MARELTDEELLKEYKVKNYTYSPGYDDLYVKVIRKAIDSGLPSHLVSDVTIRASQHAYAKSRLLSSYAEKKKEIRDLVFEWIKAASFQSPE